MYINHLEESRVHDLCTSRKVESMTSVHRGKSSPWPLYIEESRVHDLCTSRKVESMTSVHRGKSSPWPLYIEESRVHDLCTSRKVESMTSVHRGKSSPWPMFLEDLIYYKMSVYDSSRPWIIPMNTRGLRIIDAPNWLTLDKHSECLWLCGSVYKYLRTSDW